MPDKSRYVTKQVLDEKTVKDSDIYGKLFKHTGLKSCDTRLFLDEDDIHGDTVPLWNVRAEDMWTLRADVIDEKN